MSTTKELFEALKAAGYKVYLQAMDIFLRANNGSVLGRMWIGDGTVRNAEWACFKDDSGWFGGGWLGNTAGACYWTGDTPPPFNPWELLAAHKSGAEKIAAQCAQVAARTYTEIFSAGPTEVPCPDCADTEHPGLYVGLYKTEPCRTCGGSAKVTRWEAETDPRPHPTHATKPFDPEDYLGAAADSGIYFRTRLGVIPSEGVWYWNAWAKVWKSREEQSSSWRRWYGNGGNSVFAKSVDKPTSPPPPIDQIPILDGVPE